MLTDIDIYAKFYSPFEHLIAVEGISLFLGGVIFKQYFPKKHSCFHIKIYKLCNMTAYTYFISLL